MDDDEHGDDVAASGASAIILAGGRSSRMGRAKAWLAFGGVPLLVHVAARLRPLVDEIVVVAAAEQDLPPLDARIVRDRLPAAGPLPALVLGLETVTAARALVVGCDAALVSAGVLRLLLADAVRHDASATVPEWAGRLQPLVAVYHRRLLPALTALIARGERRLQSVAEVAGVHVVRSERLRAVDPDGASFRTMNTPAEYAAACRAWETRPGRG
jgi:molybdenum cofactor guanylyltransferase